MVASAGECIHEFLRYSPLTELDVHRLAHSKVKFSDIMCASDQKVLNRWMVSYDLWPAV